MNNHCLFAIAAFLMPVPFRLSGSVCSTGTGCTAASERCIRRAAGSVLLFCRWNHEKPHAPGHLPGQFPALREPKCFIVWRACAVGFFSPTSSRLLTFIVFTFHRNACLVFMLVRNVRSKRYNGTGDGTGIICIPCNGYGIGNTIYRRDKVCQRCECYAFGPQRRLLIYRAIIHGYRIEYKRYFRSRGLNFAPKILLNDFFPALFSFRS